MTIFPRFLLYLFHEHAPLGVWDFTQHTHHALLWILFVSTGVIPNAREFLQNCGKPQRPYDLLERNGHPAFAGLMVSRRVHHEAPSRFLVYINVNQGTNTVHTQNKSTGHLLAFSVDSGCWWNHHLWKNLSGLKARNVLKRFQDHSLHYEVIEYRKYE